MCVFVYALNIYKVKNKNTLSAIGPFERVFNISWHMCMSYIGYLYQYLGRWSRYANVGKAILSISYNILNHTWEIEQTYKNGKYHRIQ